MFQVGILVAFGLSIFLGRAQSNGCIYNVISKDGIIASPNFPLKYPSQKYCFWKFTTHPGYRFKIIFEFFDLEEDVKCGYDYVVLYDGHTVIGNILGKFCGNKIPPPILSATDKMLMVFHSDYKAEFSGFRATYKAGVMIGEDIPKFLRSSTLVAASIGCFHKFSEKEGVVSSPFHPQKYPGDETCIYEFEVNPKDKIKLIFESFDLESEVNCAYDNVAVYDGHSMNDTLLGRFCGNKIPPPITSTSNKMLMVFRSDPYAEFDGFRAIYKTVSWVCRYE